MPVWPHYPLVRLLRRFAPYLVSFYLCAFGLGSGVIGLLSLVSGQPSGVQRIIIALELGQTSAIVVGVVVLAVVFEARTEALARGYLRATYAQTLEAPPEEEQDWNG